MREIKFRVWHKPSHTMRIVTTLFFDPDGTLNGAGGHWPNEVYPKAMSELELMQFTGFKDKSGKEIYEGDIVNAYPYRWPQPGQKICVYTVMFSEIEGLWILKDEREVHDCPPLYTSSVLLKPLDSLEVIGNIYENPELVNL